MNSSLDGALRNPFNTFTLKEATLRLLCDEVILLTAFKLLSERARRGLSDTFNVIFLPDTGIFLL